MAVSGRDLTDLSPSRLKLLVFELQTRLAANAAAAAEPIAIVGMAGRYPTAGEDLDQVWRMLMDRGVAAQKRHAGAGGAAYSYLDHIDRFDAGFFRIPDEEAALMDPQHRLLIETAWRAMEDAGRPPSALGQRTGVYFALCTTDFADLVRSSAAAAAGGLVRGNSHGLAAGRISKLFGFDGPSLAVDTACSSSLTAVHIAVGQLRTGECDAALVGGVSILLSPLVTGDLDAAGLLSRSGLCRPLDAGADGYVRGEGCGVLVLKRLSDARRDRDRVLAIVRGSAMNHDGRGIMLAPNGPAQRKVMRRALANGGVDPAEVDLLEASSVGAWLADPVEADAADAVYGASRRAGRPILVGSVKANLGHLEAAAGIAALTKAVLCLERQAIPGHATFEAANPHLGWTDGRIRVATDSVAPASLGRALRYVAVSGFSLSGANVHLVLERASPAEAGAPPPGPFLLALSARSPAALASLAGAVADRLRRRPDALADLAFTLAAGREPGPYRLALLAADAAEAVARIERGRQVEPAPVSGPPRTAIVVADALPGEDPLLPADDGAAASAPAAFRKQLARLELLEAIGVGAAFLSGSGPAEAAAAVAAGLFDAAVGLRLAGGVPGPEPIPFRRERVPLLLLGEGREARRGELAGEDYWRGDRRRSAAELVAAAQRAGAGLVILLGEGASIAGDDSELTEGGMLGLAGALHLRGFDLDWRRLLAGTGARIVSAPTAPFDRRRHWYGDETPARPAAPAAPPPPPLGREEARDMLIGLLRHELKLDALSGSQNLLELDVTSVELVQLLGRLEKQTGFRPPVSGFYADPSVDGLVALYLDAQAAAAARPRPPATADAAEGEAPAAENAAPARPSKRFNLAAERPAHAPLLDPGWRAEHPYFRYVEPFKGELLDRLRLDRHYVRAEGVWMTDDEGRRVLDCLAQYGALPLGHNPPEIWAAIREVEARGEPVFAANSAQDAAGALAERLLGLWPEAGFSNVVFTNSGAEALEAAIKLSRAATGRHAMISSKGGFHGLTIGALSLSGNELYRQGFASADQAVQIPFGRIEALERAFTDNPGRFAGFVIEPIQGEAGIVDLPPGYLTAARQLCDRHGVLLLIDEVQTGLGRTGNLFAAQREGVVPDIMTLAKALGGGIVPIGACLYRPSARSQHFGLRHSSTFAGGALACRAGLAMLDRIARDDGALVAEVAENGRFLRARLEALQVRFPGLVGEISGRGYMQGLRLTFEDYWSTPGLLGLLHDQNVLIHLIVSHLLNVGRVRIAPSFSAGDVLRIQPPLTARREHLEFLTEAIGRTLEIVAAGDTLALTGHLLDADLAAAAAPAPSVAHRRPAARAPCTGPDVGRFGFVVHPLSNGDFARLDPALRQLDDGSIGRLVRQFAGMIDPRPIEAMEIVGSGGARAYGELILIPYTPADLVGMPPARALAEVELAVRTAQDRGAKVVGLGGFTSIVAQGGLALESKGLPALTSGNSFTASATRQRLLAACRARGLDPAGATLAIVGAGGMVARALSLLFAADFPRLVLVGNANRPNYRDRSAAMALDLIGSIRAAGKQLRAAPGSLMAALAAPGSPADPTEMLALLEADGRLVIGKPMDECLPQADAIALATSSIDGIIKPGHLKAGAIVCDVSRPLAVDAAVASERPDVLLVDAGLVRPPPGNEPGDFAGPEPGLIFACAAETIIWALEQAYDRVTPEGCMEIGSVLDLERLARKHGFEVEGAS